MGSHCVFHSAADIRRDTLKKKKKKNPNVAYHAFVFGAESVYVWKIEQT